MIITYEGQRYEFDLEDMTVRQALKIEKHIGGPLAEFEKGIGTGDLAAYQALGWLILHGGDPQVPIDEVDFKLGKLARAFEAASKAEAEAAEPGPTGAAASNGRMSVPASSLSG